MPDVYEIITQKILTQLEKGTIPWQRPWTAGNVRPFNVITGHAYRGINPLLLNCFAAERGFTSNRWVSKSQLRLKKLELKKHEEENSAIVIFWKVFENDHDENKADERKKFMLRYYRLYNTEQLQNPELLTNDKETKPVTQQKKISSCTEVIEQWDDKPHIQHCDTQACYIPTLDLINLPAPEQFYSTEGYYSTLFHEMIHATGHQTRLNRFSTSEQSVTHEEYSKEELCAEIGAAFLCGECGISVKTIENNSAYIDSWIKKLQGDSRLVVFSAAKAAKAVDYILGRAISQNNYEK